MKKYNCINCHKDFDIEYYSNNKPKQIFCSEACREEYNKNNTKYSTCRNCGKPFVVERYMSGKWDRRMYCCKQCEKEYSDKNLQQEKEVICLNCGNKFVVKRIKQGFSNSKFCSNDCMAEYRKRVPVSKGICKVCGKEFDQEYIEKFRRYTQKDYCSSECRSIGWRNYGETKESICERCGKTFLIPRSSKGSFLDRKFCDDCLNYKEQEKEVTCQKCGKTFIVKRRKIDPGHFVQRKLCDVCLEQHYKEHNIISKINQNFAEKLSNLGVNTEFEFEVENYYYDLHILDTNILIEINPTFSHTFIDTGIFTPKPPEYHLNKTQLALDNGYRCINVWDWDDWSKIINLIKPKQKLYARKLKLKEISKQLANEFIDKYHLQNSCYGNSINLGLYQDDNNLVQVMTFGKPRYNKNYQWELLRLCSHSDYYVVGGAEKLFKYFLTNYIPESIISYCDISKFTGEVYKKLGFKLLRQTASQKIWGKYSDYITDNLLRQQGADRLIGTNDGKGTSNEEIMLREGWLPIYDCGQKVFVWEV